MVQLLCVYAKKIQVAFEDVREKCRCRKVPKSLEGDILCSEPNPSAHFHSQKMVATLRPFGKLADKSFSEGEIQMMEFGRAVKYCHKSSCKKDLGFLNDYFR